MSDRPFRPDSLGLPAQSPGRGGQRHERHLVCEHVSRRCSGAVGALQTATSCGGRTWTSRRSRPRAAGSRSSGPAWSRSEGVLGGSPRPLRGAGSMVAGARSAPVVTFNHFTSTALVFALRGGWLDPTAPDCVRALLRPGHGPFGRPDRDGRHDTTEHRAVLTWCGAAGFRHGARARDAGGPSAAPGRARLPPVQCRSPEEMDAMAARMTAGHRAPSGHQGEGYLAAVCRLACRSRVMDDVAVWGRPVRPDRKRPRSTAVAGVGAGR